MNDSNKVPHLEIRELHCSPPARPALRGVNLIVPHSGFLAIVGPNGAGKGTLCRCLARLLREHEGAIFLDGKRLPDSAHALPALGMMVVMQGARVFPELSVRENLLSAPAAWRNHGRSERFARIVDLFPQLKDRLKQIGGTLSGGEQQMVAIGRALMTDPSLLVLEEPSMGLATQTASSVYQALAAISHEGKTVIVTEETLAVAANFTSAACFMEQGRISRVGQPCEFLSGNRTAAIPT